MSQRRRQEHDRQDFRNGDKYLALLRVIDPVIPRMNRPEATYDENQAWNLRLDMRIPTVFELLAESGIHLCSHLLNECFCGADVYQNPVVRSAKNLLHGVERDERLASAGRS